MQIVENNQNITSRLIINYKKILFILIIFIILAIIIISSVLIVNDSIFEKASSNRTETFIAGVDAFILNNTKVEKTPEQVQNIFNVLNNPQASDRDKYDGLINLSFLFSSAYSQTQNPIFREFSATVIEKFAENNFSSLYNKNNFNIPCSDPVCGQEFTPEIKEVFSLIKKSDMSEDYKDTISSNLSVVGHMPANEVEEKEIGFRIVYEDLIFASDPVATKAAEKLKEYAITKYNINLLDL